MNGVSGGKSLDHLGHAVVAMPKTQRAALDKATWPDLAPTGGA